MNCNASRQSPSEVVRRYWRFWAQRNKAECVALIARDATYALFVPQEVLPFGGLTSGRASLSDRLQMILDVFHTMKFEGEITRTAGDVVHGHVEYCFCHKLSGEEIEGTMRQIISVRDGLIVNWEEYTDVERVRAFMRLVAYTASE